MFLSNYTCNVFFSNLISCHDSRPSKTNNTDEAIFRLPKDPENLAVISSLHPFWYTKRGGVVIGLVVLTVIGAIVGGAVGGAKADADSERPQSITTSPTSSSASTTSTSQASNGSSNAISISTTVTTQTSV